MLGCVVTLFVTSEEMAVPKYPTIIFALFALWALAIIMADMFRIHGYAAVTTLPLEEGGHSSINPSDIRIAIPSKDNPDSAKFTVFATGGFSAMGFEFKGKEAFCVSPPEYVHMDMESGLICTTRFRQVDFDDVPDYIQSELRKLKRFNEDAVRKFGNLWFGLTSKEDGSDTDANLMVERKFITKMQELNFLKDTINELREQVREERRRRARPITFNQQQQQEEQ